MNSLAEKIMGGYRLDMSEAMDLTRKFSVGELCAAADMVRRHFLGRRVDTCSIMNAKSGRCSEDCKWCAQSAFHRTGCETYGCVSAEEALAHAAKSKAAGIRRFSLVTSGRTLSERDLERVCEAFRAMKAMGGIGLCGSFGLLSRGALARLRAAGMERIHCNLETAPSKFAELCTTHTVADKIATLNFARQEGMSLCSGGIIGMGETREQRVELAATLADIGVDSIPVNILQPIKNTPLEGVAPLGGEEILLAFAMFRLLNPRAHIRFAGGRLSIRDIQERALASGISGILMGDMLTTCGSGIASDFEMLDRLGYEY